MHFDMLGQIIGRIRITSAGLAKCCVPEPVCYCFRVEIVELHDGLDDDEDLHPSDHKKLSQNQQPKPHKKPIKAPTGNSDSESDNENLRQEMDKRFHGVNYSNSFTYPDFIDLTQQDFSLR